GRPGDIFVQKAPAASIGDLARALLELFDADNEIRIIGTRHGEKLFETLLTREEMARSEDLGKYYRIAPDTRDLNYRKYFSEGEQRITTEHDYTSHNTHRLGVDELKDLLLSIDRIRRHVTTKT
ncbi:MAG: polysaccharide biosynthesis protein, partial [Gemmatimonadota bacterium]